jgi:CHAT domain-containing protein
LAREATLTIGGERGARQWFSLNTGLIAATMLLAVVAAVVLHLGRRSSSHASLASLVSASSLEARLIEPRLSGGFSWAPFPSGKSKQSERNLDLAAAIGRTLENVRGESSAVGRHAAGVAELLAGRPSDAVSNLTAAAEASGAASAWSDLAAAYHESARRYDAPELFADALAATDRALARDSRFSEALFNRALLIERLGLKDDAREAWTRYLDNDSTGRWADEARFHLSNLAPEKPFLDILDREYQHVAGDPAAAAALVALDPFGARGMGVMEVLGRWGQAVLRSDERDAKRHLTVARHLGEAVRRAGGDRMLERAVAIIDAAGDHSRATLAAAHTDYQSGLKAFQNSRPVDAEPLLRRATSRFADARSPMVLPARYFAANTLYEQGRRDEAEQEIDSLLPTVPEEFPAYRALIVMQLGICRGSRGDWGSAIALFDQSAASFDRLGEAKNAASVRRLLAFVYDRIGDPKSAWIHRIAALRGLGGKSDLVLERTVSSIADAAIFRHEWHTASSFLSLTINIARRLSDEVQFANALLARAVIRDRLKDAPGARADIEEARAAAARVKDPAYRAYLRVAELRASAMLEATSPAVADGLLTEAIDFVGARRERLYLPALLLQRARARRSAGNIDGALADLERGIEELEQHRQSLPEGEARWGAFHAAEDLFDEAVDVVVSTDVEAAFRFAERGRARALLETYGRSPVLDQRRVPEGFVVVEYVALPSRLLIFTADAYGFRVASVECSSEMLAREIDTFTRALRVGEFADVMRGATALYSRLIEPVASQLVSASTVVFVPDSVTSTVAFSALRDSRGAYLVERHAIVVAPSAAAFVAATERRRGAAAAPVAALLISASAAASDAGALAFVDAEAQQIARAYSSAKRVSEDGLQLDDLIRRAPEADVIHFGGHAIGDERGFMPSSIVLRRNGREHRVGVSEIAKLRLRRAAVVVLAGCNTARGEQRAAEGVISVAHGFLSAGAPSVIATLWPIDDSAAATFFPRLHRELAKGVPPAEALRAVQLESIRRRDVPISLWAAVQNIGS